MANNQSILCHPPKPRTFLNVPPEELQELIYLRAVENSLLHGQMTISGAAVQNRVYMAPIEIPRKLLATHFCFFIVNSGGVGSNLRCAIYEDGNMHGYPADNPEGGRLLWDSGNLDGTITGARVIAIDELYLFPGLYWTALVFDNNVNTYLRWAAHNIFNNMLDGCRFNLAGWGAFDDPCPVVTRGTALSPLVALLVTI